MNNLFEDIPVGQPDEMMNTLLASGNVQIERIVSYGQASAEGFWYDQEQDEWVIVLRGAAQLTFENQPDPVDMNPGDFVHIPAHVRHRVEWTTPDEPTVWLAIHFSNQDAIPETSPTRKRVD